MSPLQTRTDEAAKGLDLQDLLEHIAWTDVLKPELLQAKASISTRLASAVLGNAPPGELKAEQLAGMAYGVGLVVGIIESILRRGKDSAAILREAGYNIV